MASIYENLGNDRLYCSLTGLNIEKFNELNDVFSRLYIPKKNQATGLPPVLGNPREALFFILYYLKTYPTLQNMGVCFGFSDTTAHKYIKYILPFLKHSLKEKESLAHRVFESPESFKKAFEGVSDIFIDGTEITIERSKDPFLQEDCFSGKKKRIR